MHILDPKTLQAATLQPLVFWKTPFTPALTRAALVEFVVLDLEYDSPTLTLAVNLALALALTLALNPTHPNPSPSPEP